MDEPREQLSGPSNKARRHAAKAARLAADPNMAPALNPSASGFAPLSTSSWDTFVSQAQDQTQFLSQKPHTPFWPTPDHHEISHPPNRAPLEPRGHHYGNPPPPRSNSKQFGERDAIVPPSAASGGVPDPSPAYLLRASFLPQTTPSPHPLLVIIDLNGTLLHRPSRQRPHHFIARPHAREFLTYCLDTFSVMIWSSARMSNVQAMCADLLTPDQLSRCLAVWGREHFGLTPQDYASRVQVYKRLSQVWGDEKIQTGYPTDWEGGMGADSALVGAGNRVVGGGKRWDQGNTVLIDDSAEKARSEPYNAIQIPEFTGGGEKMKKAVLPKVHDYINTLACQADVSTYIRVNPFKFDG